MESLLKDLNKNILIDCDEVLVNISPKFYRLILKNFSTFKDYFKNLGMLEDFEILRRSEYYLNEWLKLTPDTHIPQEIIDSMLDLYTVPDFYDDLQLTTFGKGLKFALYNSKFVKSLVILTHTFPKNEESKNKFLVSHFNDERVTITHIPITVKKIDFVKEHNIEFDIFIDDRKDTLMDFINHFQFKEFSYPEMGYNTMTREEIIDHSLLIRKNKVIPYKNFI